MSQVGDLNSDHQDRDRSCDERRVGVRASRTSSSSPLWIGLSRRSGDQKDSFVRHILSFALGHRRRHRPRSATPGPACRGTGALPAHKKRHRAAQMHPLACPLLLPAAMAERSSHCLSFPLPPSQALSARCYTGRLPSGPPPMPSRAYHPTFVSGSDAFSSRGCSMHVLASVCVHVRTSEREARRPSGVPHIAVSSGQPAERAPVPSLHATPPQVSSTRRALRSKVRRSPRICAAHVLA